MLKHAFKNAVNQQITLQRISPLEGALELFSAGGGKIWRYAYVLGRYVRNSLPILYCTVGFRNKTIVLPSSLVITFHGHSWHTHMLEQTSSTNVSCPGMFKLLHVPLLFMSALCYCMVWSPHFKSEIDRTESVQLRLTKRLCFLNNMSYSTVSC